MKSNFFEANGYKCIHLSLSTEGQYSPKDSEWNYSDIPHLNHIHTKVDSLTLSASRNHISNVFLQQIGPLILPASVSISHTRPDIHDYCMIILNIAIFVRTTHGTNGNNGLTTTDYKFMYKGAVGYLVSQIARMATKRNYRTLMSEDMPMRMQRGRLRQRGITFKMDSQELIGFADTLDINKNHVDATHATHMSMPFEYLITTDSGEAVDEFHYLNLTWENGLLDIYPSICPHEGADLSHTFASCSAKRYIHCPWHGKKITPLATICLNSGETRMVNVYNKNLRIQAKHDNSDNILKLLLTICAENP